MRGLLSGLVLLPLTFAEAEPEPAYSPFFPRLSPEALEILGVGPDPSPEPRETFLDECSKHTTCGDCATASSFFTSCRWCPKFGDVSCHVVGSLSNTCESDEQIVEPDQCPPLAETRIPTIILPGLIGTNLEAKLTDKPNKPSPVCSTNSDWFTVWISGYEVAPEFYKCMLDNIEVHYDDVTETVSNNQGVEVRAGPYGATVDAVQCLVPDSSKLCGMTGNWNNFIKTMQAKGYVVGKDLYSATYDFRMGEHQFIEHDYPKLKTLVEEVYEQNGGTPVAFVSISYGGPFGAAFLTHYVNQDWKDKYINSFVSLSGVFNGAPMVTHQLVSGMPAYGLTWIDDVALRDALREWPSLSWLLPTYVPDDVNDPDGDRVIMYTDIHNYTISELPDLLEAAGATGAAAIKRKQVITPVSDPGVKVHCWFTEDMYTEWGYYQSMENITAAPGVLYGMGDTTADKLSLNRCENWKDVEVRKFSNITHSGYLSNEDILDDVVELLAH